MSISFDKIGDISATFNGSSAKGDIVTISASKTVAKANDGNVIAGVCTDSSNGKCTVSLKGFFTFTYSGTAITVGQHSVNASGDNKIKLTGTGETGTTVLVVDADATTKTVTVLM